MKKTKFKSLKEKAVNYLADFPADAYNRYTKEELKEALGKDHFNENDSKEDVKKLITWVLNKFKVIKFNLKYHTLDFHLLRSKDSEGKFHNKIVPNIKYSFRKSMRSLEEYRIAMVDEIDIANTIYNELFDIFECLDTDSEQWPIELIRDNPHYGLPGDALNSLVNYFYAG